MKGFCGDSVASVTTTKNIIYKEYIYMFTEGNIYSCRYTTVVRLVENNIL